MKAQLLAFTLIALPLFADEPMPMGWQEMGEKIKAGELDRNGKTIKKPELEIVEQPVKVVEHDPSAHWMKAAKEKYPGMEYESLFFERFERIRKALSSQKSQIFNDPKWPMMIADQTAEDALQNAEIVMIKENGKIESVDRISEIVAKAMEEKRRQETQAEAKQVAKIQPSPHQDSDDAAQIAEEQLAIARETQAEAREAQHEANRAMAAQRRELNRLEQAIEDRQRQQMIQMQEIEDRLDRTNREFDRYRQEKGDIFYRKVR